MEIPNGHINGSVQERRNSSALAMDIDMNTHYIAASTEFRDICTMSIIFFAWNGFLFKLYPWPDCMVNWYTQNKKKLVT